MVGGMFDINASAVGSGAVREGLMCVIAGTWSINEVVAPRPIVNERLNMCTLFVVPGLWLMSECSPTSATNLEWFVSNFCGEEKAEAEARGISVYEVCNDLVGSLPPGGTDVIFHPFLFGSNVQANARAGFYGLGAWHTKAHVVRALYEGVVYSHLDHVNRLRAAGATIDAGADDRRRRAEARYGRKCSRTCCNCPLRWSAGRKLQPWAQRSAQAWGQGCTAATTTR